MNDLTGQEFGELTVISDTGKRARQGSVIWLCRCRRCGNFAEVHAGYLTQKAGVVSCGCLKVERARSMGRGRRKVDPARVRAMLAEGLSVAVVAERLGVSPGAIYANR